MFTFHYSVILADKYKPSLQKYNIKQIAGSV